MTSLTRMLEIVDLYSVERPLWTAEEIAARLSYSRGSTYRYLKELVAAGLLVNVAGGYAPGPRIIELDFVIRESDPYSGIVLPVMRNLNQRLQCEVLACRYYRGRVVVSHHFEGTDKMTMSYGRGRRMPLFLGAGSKSILASMKKGELKRLFDANEALRREQGITSDWDAFFADVKKTRRRGYADSYAELDEGNVGLAAPLKLTPYGCIVLVFRQSRFDIIDEKRVIGMLTDAVQQANALIANIEAGEDPVAWLTLSDAGPSAA
ncbi:MAG: helix-turn-helix domain-containing protein [Rhodospirillaceae bacterium]|nr:helix-turn-helix domain-containing protein [Rhodospirillaceae bacterium]